MRSAAASRFKAVIEALREVQPARIRGQDQLLDAEIRGNFRLRAEIGKSNFPLFGEFQRAALWYLFL
jgi:hypothetical protein